MNVSVSEWANEWASRLSRDGKMAWKSVFVFSDTIKHMVDFRPRFCTKGISSYACTVHILYTANRMNPRNLSNKLANLQGGKKHKHSQIHTCRYLWRLRFWLEILLRCIYNLIIAVVVFGDDVCQADWSRLVSIDSALAFRVMWVLILNYAKLYIKASGPKFVIAEYDGKKLTMNRDTRSEKKKSHRMYAVYIHIWANMYVCVSVDDACVRFGLGVVCLS